MSLGRQAKWPNGDTRSCEKIVSPISTGTPTMVFCLSASLVLSLKIVQHLFQNLNLKLCLHSLFVCKGNFEELRFTNLERRLHETFSAWCLYLNVLNGPEIRIGKSYRVILFVLRSAQEQPLESAIMNERTTMLSRSLGPATVQIPAETPEDKFSTGCGTKADSKYVAISSCHN